MVDSVCACFFDVNDDTSWHIRKKTRILSMALVDWCGSWKMGNQTNVSESPCIWAVYYKSLTLFKAIWEGIPLLNRAQLDPCLWLLGTLRGPNSNKQTTAHKIYHAEKSQNQKQPLKNDECHGRSVQKVGIIGCGPHSHVKITLQGPAWQVYWLRTKLRLPLAKNAESPFVAKKLLEYHVSILVGGWAPHIFQQDQALMTYSP